MMLPLTHFSRGLLLVAASLSLGACAALSGKHDTYTVYAPQLNAGTAQPAASLDWQLLVDQPRASNAIDSSRIAVMPRPGVLEVYANARWRDPAPAMLRSLLVEAFDRDGRIGGVSAIDSGLNGDYSLSIELRDFQIEIGSGSPIAAIRLTAKLFDRSTNRIVASQSFEETAPSTSSDVASGFAAFEQALNQLLPRIVDWTCEQGSASQRATDQ